MIFAEFYYIGAISKKPIPSCGDRSILILDGRYSNCTHNTICIDWAKKHDFIGYTINYGDSLTRNIHELQSYRSVDNE